MRVFIDLHFLKEFFQGLQSGSQGGEVGDVNQEVSVYVALEADVFAIGQDWWRDVIGLVDIDGADFDVCVVEPNDPA